MLIRLLGGYWPDFTGKFGLIDFVDGVAEVSASDAEYLGRLVEIEEVRDRAWMRCPEDKRQAVSVGGQPKHSKREPMLPPTEF